MANFWTARARLHHRLLGGICLAIALSHGSASAQEPLTFGVFPYLTAKRLVSDFTPLKDFLQQVTGQPVVMVTAPSYREFAERTRNGDYDIVFTPPHFGVQAEKESHFQRIAMTRYQIAAVILVSKDSPLQKLADLRGKTLAVPPKLSLVYLLAVKLLRDQGLAPGRDVSLREFTTNQNSMAAPLRGDADAGATGILLWQKSGQHESMRVLAESPAVSGFFLMGHSRLSSSTIAQLRKRILEFGDTEPGRAYFAATHHGAWLPIDNEVIRHVEAATH